jgi:DNA-binding MarR family transcriptional regulator
VPLSYRIADSLRSGSRTPHELAEALGADTGTIARTLRRMRERGRVRDMPGPDGVMRWGLTA